MYAYNGSRIQQWDHCKLSVFSLTLNVLEVLVCVDPRDGVHARYINACSMNAHVFC